MNPDKYLIATHAQCKDGAFAAALMYTTIEACYRLAGQPVTLEVIELKYGKPEDDVAQLVVAAETTHVILTDYRLPSNHLEAIRSRVKTLTVFDHHPLEEGMKYSFLSTKPIIKSIKSGKTQSLDRLCQVLGYTYVNQEKCGTSQVYDVALSTLIFEQDNDIAQVPQLLDLAKFVKATDIADRFVTTQFTDENLGVLTWLETVLKRDWKLYLDFIHNQISYEDAVFQSTGMSLYINYLSERILADMVVDIEVFTPMSTTPWLVKGVWCPYELAAKVGNEIASRTMDIKYAGNCLKGIAAIICKENKVSFRSVDGCEVNARTLAKQLGGGGHNNAAGANFEPGRVRVRLK